MKKQPTKQAKTARKTTNEPAVDKVFAETTNAPQTAENTPKTGAKPYIAELAKFEKQMQTATKHNYAVGLGVRDAKELFDLYSKVFGFEYNGVPSCSVCQLEILKQLGVYYYER